MPAVTFRHTACVALYEPDAGNTHSDLSSRSAAPYLQGQVVPRLAAAALPVAPLGSGRGI